MGGSVRTDTPMQAEEEDEDTVLVAEVVWCDVRLEYEQFCIFLVTSHVLCALAVPTPCMFAAKDRPNCSLDFYIREQGNRAMT